MHSCDLADVRGLELPKLALEVAVAGQHPLLLVGPAGSGKSMLTRRIAGLLPDLGPETGSILGDIRVRAGLADEHVTRPPVRMPHHTVSPAGLLGGGNPPRPGEVSLAHGGVLVLDELPEFTRSTLAGLGWTMRERKAEFVRAAGTTTYPADFLLVGLASWCPCGYLRHPERVCTDSRGAVQRYLSRLDVLRPLWDLVVQVTPEVGEYGESSEAVRSRIWAAKGRSLARALVGAQLPCEIDLDDSPEGERTRRVATTLVDLGRTSSTEAITADAVELARSLFDYPNPDAREEAA